jgi:hypothetical protein
MIYLLRKPATAEQIKQMLAAYESYILVAVDVARERIAAGGDFPVECESLLVEDGSKQQDIWGADWIPAEQTDRKSVV